MAFKIEFLSTKEELNRLGVDDYESELTKRRTFKGEKNSNLWSEFGSSHLIYEDEESDMWLVHLGNTIRGIAHATQSEYDIFLFNYKGSIIELLLEVEKGTPERGFCETFDVTYIKLVQMNPSSLPDVSQENLIKFVCEAFKATEIGELFLAEFGKKYAYEIASKKIILKFLSLPS